MLISINLHAILFAFALLEPKSPIQIDERLLIKQSEASRFCKEIAFDCTKSRVAKYFSAEFPDIKGAINAIQFINKDGSEANLTYFADLNSSFKLLHHSKNNNAECDYPKFDISEIKLIHISNRPIIVVSETDKHVGCCGVSSKESVSDHLFDATNDFNEILVLNKSRLDLKDDECGTNKDKPISSQTFYYQNGCLSETNCVFISFVVVSNVPKFKQQYFSYGWNNDTTKLIPVK